MSAINDTSINEVKVMLGDANDPVANKISWNPVKRGGANFQIHKMVERGLKIVVRRTFRALVFYSSFMIPGLGLLLYISPIMYQQGADAAGTISLVIGITFTVSSFFMWARNQGMTFDKASGTYFKGKRYDSLIKDKPTSQGNLSDIYALQIISESVRSDNGSFRSYELNLVFRDGKRANVMEHSKSSALDKSAKKLAGYLNVPVWKAKY
ncbi:hypothetical protein L4D06_05095 [Enterovibrio makurazakiensis]|uniref:hypothetical protein n=1 Tax=Enterovibrio makurazakiensis TaxID=2910232 RepID=UPI003D1E4B37